MPRVAFELKEQGYVPDIISPPRLETYSKAVWPNARLKLYCEFFTTPATLTWISTRIFLKGPNGCREDCPKNANLLPQFHNAESGLSPTSWQASTFPTYIRERLSIAHDGIDTDLLKPNSVAELILQSGKVLTSHDEVITYVAARSPTGALFLMPCLSSEGKALQRSLLLERRVSATAQSIPQEEVEGFIVR